MPRGHKWSVESLNMSKSSDSLEALPAPLLSPGEVRKKRLELAQEMLMLLMGDDALGKRPRAALQRISVSLGDIRRLL
jgi:hypothetical protein